jgi:hypothetical protein
MLYQIRVKLVKPKEVEVSTMGTHIVILDMLVEVAWTVKDAIGCLERLQPMLPGMCQIYPYGCTRPVDLRGMAPGATTHVYIKASD